MMNKFVDVDDFNIICNIERATIVYILQFGMKLKHKLLKKSY
jgi:hypothetical protein